MSLAEIQTPYVAATVHQSRNAAMGKEKAVIIISLRFSKPRENAARMKMALLSTVDRTIMKMKAVNAFRELLWTDEDTELTISS